MLGQTDQYTTAGGVFVRRTCESLPVQGASDPLIAALDSQRGVLLASSYEYPGRYTRWDLGFVNPPLCLTARGRAFELAALNARGAALLPALAAHLEREPAVVALGVGATVLTGSVALPDRPFAEEERSRQPSVFSVLRALVALFHSPADPHLGLYGAFGYDLAFQFEPIRLRLPRPADQRDLVLYLPDELLVVDHRRERAMRCRYEFALAGHSTEGLPRAGTSEPFVPDPTAGAGGDHAPGEYAATVRRAREAFARGDLFEVVPSQTFFEPCPAPPSELFRRLRERNPAPYGFLINLGEQEYLVGASPEMYVRVTNGRRVETCPISGTIRRGRNAIEDEAQIRTLLNSKKDEAELTMCSDVDRNDKSRICEPGSVRVIGRRQIEMYSRLIHTVDHIEGRLLEGMDALDAFLSHAWAVTVTGAPKLWAMQFIEDHEKSPRAWYGGAVGAILMNGDLNTGLTLRTVRIKDGICQVRAGATLLYDSDPMEEERETELKASAMLAAIREAGKERSSLQTNGPELVGAGVKVVLVDHEDSFVHTLANYFRQTGAAVTTIRSTKGEGMDPAEFDRLQPDLVVMSPGPGSPSDFHCTRTILAARERGLPIFGVCLGLQAMAEATGGELARLEVPFHGKPSEIGVARNSMLFAGLPERIIVGRYHSIHALREKLPAGFAVSAATDDGVVMAIEHQSEAMAAVQFHPESIMSLGDDAGHRIVENAIRALVGKKRGEMRPAANSV